MSYHVLSLVAMPNYFAVSNSQWYCLRRLKNAYFHHRRINAPGSLSWSRRHVCAPASGVRTEVKRIAQVPNVGNIVPARGDGNKRRRVELMTSLSQHCPSSSFALKPMIVMSTNCTLVLLACGITSNHFSSTAWQLTSFHGGRRV